METGDREALMHTAALTHQQGPETAQGQLPLTSPASEVPRGSYHSPVGPPSRCIKGVIIIASYLPGMLATRPIL